MSTRTLLIIIFSIIGAFLLVIGAFFGTYTYDRTILGFPPRPQDSLRAKLDSIQKSQDARQAEIDRLANFNVEMPKEEFEEMQRDLIRKALIKKQNDSLIAFRNKLLDSLKNVQNFIEDAKDSVKSISMKMSEKEKGLKELSDSLAKIERKFMTSQDQIERLKNMLENSEEMIKSRYDSLEVKNFKEFAKIYNNTSPTEVARILEQIDETDAAMILKFMRTKKAGKVLDAMMPEQAAAILLFGVQ